GGRFLVELNRFAQGHVVPRDLQFSFHPVQRQRFQNGARAHEWHGRFPDLFDTDDLRLAKTQPDRHFFEWLAAVLFFESMGYWSLIEKYETKLHRRKIEHFSKTVPPHVRDFVLSNRAGLPDLFVFRPNSPDWFFCEIKGGPDRVSPQL